MRKTKVQRIVLSILVTSVEQASPAFRCTQAIKCSLEQIAYTKSALPLNC